MTERDMEELWEANCQVIREALASRRRRGGKNPRHCCSGHGKGLYLWGKDNKPAITALFPLTAGPGNIRSSGRRTARRKRPLKRPIKGFWLPSRCRF